MGSLAPCTPTVLCLLLACVWLPRGEPADQSLRVQSLGEKDVD